MALFPLFTGEFSLLKRVFTTTFLACNKGGNDLSPSYVYVHSLSMRFYCLLLQVTKQQLFFLETFTYYSVYQRHLKRSCLFIAKKNTTGITL